MGGVGGVLLEAESRTTGGASSADKSRGEGGEKRNTAQRGSQLWGTALSQGEAALGDPTSGGLAAPSHMPGREMGYHTTAPATNRQAVLSCPSHSEEGSAGETKPVMLRKHTQ